MGFSKIQQGVERKKGFRGRTPEESVLPKVARLFGMGICSVALPEVHRGYYPRLGHDAVASASALICGGDQRLVPRKLSNGPATHGRAGFCSD